MAAKAGPANLNIIIDVCYARLNPTGAVDKIWPYITWNSLANDMACSSATPSSGFEESAPATLEGHSSGNADSQGDSNYPTTLLNSLIMTPNDLISHLTNCFSEMLTFFICIFILRRWLHIDLWPFSRRRRPPGRSRALASMATNSIYLKFSLIKMKRNNHQQM